MNNRSESLHKYGFEEGLKHEQSGNFDLALSLYIAEVKSGRTTKDAVRGLFRSTIKVGDISSLTFDFPDLCRSSGISDNCKSATQSDQGKHLGIGGSG